MSSILSSHSALDFFLECQECSVQLFSASLLPLLVDPIPFVSTLLQLVVHPCVLLSCGVYAVVPFSQAIYFHGVHISSTMEYSVYVERMNSVLAVLMLPSQHGGSKRSVVALGGL